MSPSAASFVQAVADAPTWDARVGEVRKIADQVSRAEQAAVYSAVAKAFYVPSLTYEFSEVAWPTNLGDEAFHAEYAEAVQLTIGFTAVSDDDLTTMLEVAPATLRVLRLVIGFTQQEFAAATNDAGLPVSASSLKTMERGGRPRDASRVAARCAITVNRIIAGELYPAHEHGPLRTKLQKVDTLGPRASAGYSRRQSVNCSIPQASTTSALGPAARTSSRSPTGLA